MPTCICGSQASCDQFAIFHIHASSWSSWIETGVQVTSRLQVCTQRTTTGHGTTVTRTLTEIFHKFVNYSIFHRVDTHQYKWDANVSQINGYGSAKMMTLKELQKHSDDFLVEGALHVRVALQVEAPLQVNQ